MAQVLGLERLERSLRQHLAKHLESPNAVKGHSVIVGYTANYALYVHETFRPAPGATRKARGVGQGKFLEQPARELNNSGELGRVVSQAMRNRAKLQQALYLAGLRLQRESQQLTPVDTGNLKGSAFTRKE